MRLLSPIPPTANVRIITGLEKIAFWPRFLRCCLVFGKAEALDPCQGVASHPPLLAEHGKAVFGVWSTMVILAEAP